MRLRTSPHLRGLVHLVQTDGSGCRATMGSDGRTMNDEHAADGVADASAGRAAVRFLSLDAARALECNGCGDCCDSRRTDGYWTWGALPPHQYRAMADGEPLIIPLQRVDGQWQERAHAPQDAQELSPTRFRCAAFEEQADGGGRCGRHGRDRPPRCGEFPLWQPALESELREHGAVRLHTDAFPRCSWYRACVVADDDPRLQQPPG